MLRGLVRLIRHMDGLTRQVELDTLQQLLAEANVRRDEMVEACKFSNRNYARNLIAKSPWYQLLVICWQAGQSSPIHDHCGSACGVRVVDGIASETIFEKVAARIVRPLADRSYQPGDVCVSVENDIHVITNRQFGQDLITLHLYSPPLQMNFYELDPAYVGPFELQPSWEI